MKITICIFSILFSLLMGAKAYADPEVTIRTDYYDIVGSTSRDLRREMSSKGPPSDNPRRRYWAMTRWYVSWDILPGCQVKTTVTIDYTYPRWVNRADPDTNMGRKWDRMYQALVAHEQTHASHGISAAKQIESELMQLSNHNHCHNINFMQEVNHHAQQIIQHYKNEDIQYDKRTAHGFNEGVKLP